MKCFALSVAVLACLIPAAGEAGPGALPAAGAPPGFRFILHFGYTPRGDAYDSATGMWRVDRLCDPDDTLCVHLTSTQLDTIWMEFNRVGFFGFPATLTPTVNPDGTEESIRPRSVTTIEVMTSTMRNSVYWDGGVGPYSAHDQELIAVVRGVELRLWATPQYTALPPLRCMAE